MSKERLDNSVLENAISTYKTVVEVAGDIIDEDYSPVLDKVTLAFLEELKQYRDLEEQGLLLRLPCHCKDCKHVDYAGCAGTTCYCMKNGVFMQEDDFCKYAEKDEAEEKLRELNKENEE